MQTSGFFGLNFFSILPKNLEKYLESIFSKSLPNQNLEKKQNKTKQNKTRQKQVTPAFLHSVKLFALARANKENYTRMLV
jgi:hypothetical protein